MGHPPGQKEAGRAKVLASAGKGFRQRGFGGLGIDAIAKQAGVTSGAFYAHFKSKAEAFRESVVAGLVELRLGVGRFKSRFGVHWKQHFIEFYLTERRTCDLGDSCALQSLSADVARADDATKAMFEAELRQVIEAVESGQNGPTHVNREQAIVLLALLSGGVTLARAVKDPEFSAEIAAAIKTAAMQLGGEDKPANQ